MRVFPMSVELRYKRRVRSIPGLAAIVYLLVSLAFAVGAASAVHSENPRVCK